MEVVYTKEEGAAKAETPNTSVRIGDKVTYQISTSTSNYVTYKMEEDKKVLDLNGNISEKVKFVYITDKMGEGLTYNQDMAVMVNKTKTDDYILTKKDNNFTVVLRWLDNDGNPLYNDGAVVTIQYSAIVNENINVVGDDGTASDNSENNASVSVDSTPDNGEVPGEDPNPTPGTGGSTQNVVTGSVSVFIYALAIQKIDSNTNVMKGVNADTFTINETKAPVGYNLLTSAQNFEAITAGTTKTTTTATTTVYYKQDNNGSFKKVGETFVEIEEGDNVEEAEKYAISNTVTENKETKEDKDFFKESAVYMTVKNAQGTELPSTGGMGTTLFYMVGAILVLGAGVLLITRKRMSVR